MLTKRAANCCSYSTPHSITGVSPAELLFRRRIRIATVRGKKRERCMQTSKGMYVKARFEKVIRFLLRLEKENKLSTLYKKFPFTVIQKNGDSVLVEADSVQYRRNVNHVKKYSSEIMMYYHPLVNQQMPQRVKEQHKVYQTKSP